MAVAYTAWAQTAPTPSNQESKASAASAPQLEDFERRIGPLEIAGQKFTILLHLKRVRATGRTDPDFQETAASMEIRDAAGKVHYQKTFPYQMDGASFSETTAVYAHLLAGGNGTGLLITYGFLPSTPLGGESWQVFGVVNGKLAPFSKPFSTEGSLVEASAGDILKTSAALGSHADALEFRVWTGSFFVIVPLRVDWLLGRVTPAWRCLKMTARGPRAVCQFRVEAERRPSDALTFVRLFPDSDENAGIAQHAVVKTNSKVEFLGAEAALAWREETEGIGFGVSEDVWLKVRIDEKEGWIHSQEDFTAIGLPMAG